MIKIKQLDFIFDFLFQDLEHSYNKEIVKGIPIKIAGRTIHPVIQLLTFEMSDKFWCESITPIAIAVIESDDKYFISLFEEDDEVNELLKKDGLWDELGI